MSLRKRNFLLMLALCTAVSVVFASVASAATPNGVVLNTPSSVNAVYDTSLCSSPYGPIACVNMTASITNRTATAQTCTVRLSHNDAVLFDGTIAAGQTQSFTFTTPYLDGMKNIYLVQTCNDPSLAPQTAKIRVIAS